jgi:hypothetical protein
MKKKRKEIKRNVLKKEMISKEIAHKLLLNRGCQKGMFNKPNTKSR